TANHQLLPQETIPRLLDHLVGAGEQVGWDGEAKRFCGLEVDHELELCRLHDWQVGRFRALENPTGVDASLAICIGETASVAHQATGCDKLAPRVNKRDALTIPLHVFCPSCFCPMHLSTAHVGADGTERIRFVCDRCATETV